MNKVIYSTILTALTHHLRCWCYFLVSQDIIVLPITLCRDRQGLCGEGKAGSTGFCLRVCTLIEELLMCLEICLEGLEAEERLEIGRSIC